MTTPNRSLNLRTYLRLEKAMLEADDGDEECADRLRDMMDPIWWSMTDDEHRSLEARGDFDAIVAMHGLPSRSSTLKVGTADEPPSKRADMTRDARII